MKIPDGEVMLSVKEQAVLTGLSPYTIHHKIQKGELPYNWYQVAPTKKVSKKRDVLAWLETVKGGKKIF